MISFDEHTADCFHRHLIWSTRALGLAILLQSLHKALFSPLALTVSTHALFALAVVAFLVHLVICLRRAEAELATEPVIYAPGARLAAWVVSIAISIALVAGYVGLAAFIGLRAVVAASLLSALYLLLNVTDAMFTDGLAPNSSGGRRIAANLGLPPRSVGILGTVLSASVRVTLIILALVLIFGPWEVSTADLVDSVQSVPFSFQIGEITVSFRAILAAAVVLIITLLITRTAQRWLQRELLPRTTLEPSLQLSVSTIFGYLGGILGVAMAMASLGIDLQKIAFVAGALSVGIGFGLQSIVSNFVSGLILLAERPIRVGDSIVVQGEEGSVRRIRVRATEIETPQRASVIIPNSVLISGMVKNNTHTNTLGLVIIQIGVGYDSDPEQVRDLLLAVANEHPEVTKNPAPGAFFIAFGESALQFELRCVIANLNKGLNVKSDLNFEILKRCRAAGIEIPYPQRDINIRAETVVKEGPAGPAAATS